MHTFHVAIYAKTFQRGESPRAKCFYILQIHVIELNRNIRRKSESEPARYPEKEREEKIDGGMHVSEVCTVSRRKRTRNFYSRQQRIIRFLCVRSVRQRQRAPRISMIYCIQHYLFVIFSFPVFHVVATALAQICCATTTAQRFRYRTWITFRLIFFRFFCHFFGVIFPVSLATSSGFYIQVHAATASLHCFPAHPIIFWCETKHPLKKLRQNQDRMHKNKKSKEV